MSDLETTYLRVSVITCIDRIHVYLKEIFREAYEVSIAPHQPDLKNREERIKAKNLIQANMIPTFAKWRCEVTTALCGYLDHMYNCEDGTPALESIISKMSDVFYVAPIDGKYTLDAEQQSAIEELYDLIDDAIANTRELYDRPSSEELIKFSSDSSGGYIIIELWGDRRIHLFNEMIKKGK